MTRHGDHNGNPDPQSQQSSAQHSPHQRTDQHGHRTGPGHTNPPASGPQRIEVPTGLRLVSLTFAGMGCALVYGGLLLLNGASQLAAYGGPASSSVTLIGLVLAGFGGGQLGAAYGTWARTPWGRKLGLYLAAGSLVWSVLFLAAGGPAGPLGVMIYGGLTWYLYTNRELYKRLQRRRSSTSKT